MSNDYPQQTKAIRAARVQMLIKNPFFADLAFGLPIVFCKDLHPPTAVIDGESVRFHPDFVSSLTSGELVFVLAHEIMHPALFHCTRRGNRDPKLWNIACDIVVNYVLIENNVGTMPKIGISEPKYYKRGGGKAEKIYDLLVQENKERLAAGKPGIGDGKESGEGGAESSLDVILDADGGRRETIAAKWRTKVAQAAQVARAAGALSGSLEELAKELLEPKVRWENLLRNFILTTRGEEHTWTKPNRRYRASGIYLPGVYGEKLEEIAILVDCSGSVSNKMLAQAKAEITYIQEELRPDKIHVLYFDTEVKKHEEYSADDALDIKAYGRGGTDFATSFKYLEEQGIEPSTCIVLTDLDCDSYGPQPSYPVLWVSDKMRTTPPWGQTVSTNE